MKVNIFRKSTFEFSDLEYGIPDAVTQDLNKSIVTYARIIWEVWDEPQKELDGGTTYFDYDIQGYECNKNGQRDKRQVRPLFVKFVDARQTYKFLLSLLDSLDTEKMALDTYSHFNDLRTEVKNDLDRAVARDLEELERLKT